ncbi:MAG: transposase [Phycisphaerales bacterium]
MTRTKTDQADVRAIADLVHTLSLKAPEKLEHTRLVNDPQRDDLALWLQEFDRCRRSIARLRNQIHTIKHETASVASVILKRREDQLARMLEEQQEVKREVEAAFRVWKSRDAELLCSIKGVGVLTAASILTSIGSIDQFQSADAFKGFFGIYPRRRQSGKSEKPSRLANHGNQLVRHNLWNAARSAVMYNPLCRAYFEQLVARGKHKAAAYGAVARKLLQIIYGVLKTRTHFKIPETTT